MEMETETEMGMENAEMGKDDQGHHAVQGIWTAEDSLLCVLLKIIGEAKKESSPGLYQLLDQEQALKLLILERRQTHLIKNRPFLGKLPAWSRAIVRRFFEDVLTAGDIGLGQELREIQQLSGLLKERLESLLLKIGPQGQGITPGQLGQEDYLLRLIKENPAAAKIAAMQIDPGDYALQALIANLESGKL